MTIVMVYHHHERILTNELSDLFERLGHKVMLAPLGWKVGSDNWKKEVQLDIKAATKVIVLLTPLSSKDEWVNWRIQLAKELKKTIIPIMLEPCSVDEWPHSLQGIQHIDLSYNPLQTDNNPIQVENNLNLSCFISYAREDTTFATKLTESLRLHNVNVWRDEDNIPLGTPWDKVVEEALNKCSHVLLIATPNSVVSPNVSDEISFALNENKIVIPIIAADCKLPLRVHRAQWVDFRGHFDDALNTLLRKLTMKQ